MGPGLPNTKGNYWTSGTAFPAATTTSFYLGAGGSLSTTSPAANGNVSYNYDPTNPVPTIGGNNLLMICGPWDQVL